MNAGTLEVSLVADVARLKAGVERGVGYVRKGADAMERAAGTARTALAGIAGGLSAGVFVAWVRGAIDAADNLNDLSKSTDIAVGKLAGLGMVARMSGGDLQGAAGAVNKLQTEIGKSPEQFRAIGITAKDGIGALKQLADIYSGLEDPQLRAAVAAQALGKGWQGAGSILAEGGTRIQELIDKGEMLSGVTQDTADKADAFNDSLVITQTWLGGVATRIAGDMLPLLTAMSQGLEGTADQADKMAGSFSWVTETLRALLVFGGNVAFVLRGVGTEIGGIAAQAMALASGNFSGAASIGEKMREDAKSARAAFDAWEQRMISAGTAAQVTAAKATDASRKLSEAQLAALKLFADAEAKAAADKAIAKAKKAAEDWQKWLAKVREQGAKLQAEEAEETAKALVEESKQREAGRKAVNDYARSVDENLALLEIERAMMGKTAQQRQVAIEQFQTELELKKQIEAIDANLAFNEEQREELREKARIKARQAGLAVEERVQMEQDRQRSESIAASIEDGILNGFREGRSLADVFLDELKAQFARTVLRPMIQPVAEAGNSLLGDIFKGAAGLLGGGWNGGNKGMFAGAASADVGFSGGGYTGDAPRSGGMDGQGGFMAMLHPRETVVDHAAGQGAGVTIVSNPTINIDSRSDQGAVMAGVQRALGENNKALMEQLRRQGVLA